MCQQRESIVNGEEQLPATSYEPDSPAQSTRVALAAALERWSQIARDQRLVGEEGDTNTQFALDAARAIQEIEKGENISSHIIPLLSHFDNQAAVENPFTRELRHLGTQMCALYTCKLGCQANLPLTTPIYNTSTDTSGLGFVQERKIKEESELEEDQSIFGENRPIKEEPEDFEYELMGEVKTEVKMEIGEHLEEEFKQVRGADMANVARLVEAKRANSANSPPLPEQPLIKSEMFGDDSLSEWRLAEMRLNSLYEQVARMGIQDQFVMGYLGGPCERRKNQCDRCCLMFATKKKLEYHLQEVHPLTEQQKMFFAYIKKERAALLKAAEKWEAAQKSCYNRAVYTCSICNEEMETQRALSCHQRNHRREGQLATGSSDTKRDENEEAQVPTTIETTQTAPPAISSAHKRANVAVNRSKNLPDENGAYKCKICSRTFSNPRAVGGHMRHCRSSENNLGPKKSAATSVALLKVVKSKPLDDTVSAPPKPVGRPTRPSKRPAVNAAAVNGTQPSVMPTPSKKARLEEPTDENKPGQKKKRLPNSLKTSAAPLRVSRANHPSDI